MEQIEARNALITSVDLFVDLTHTHLTIHLEYADAVQLSGPHLLSDEILRFLTQITGERRPTLIRDKPCRVKIDHDRDVVIEIGHFLKEEWLVLK